MLAGRFTDRLLDMGLDADAACWQTIQPVLSVVSVDMGTGLGDGGAYGVRDGSGYGDGRYGNGYGGGVGNGDIGTFGGSGRSEGYWICRFGRETDMRDGAELEVILGRQQETRPWRR